LSRQLYGKTIASERPGHRMMEQYHPLGPVGIISAFNFPSAVFAWNAAIALVCGNPIVFKPSEKATVSGLATFKALERAIGKFGPEAPAGLAQILIGNASFGQALVDSRDIALVSATGSTRMGLDVAQKVAARFGKRILELGGNNAMIVTPSADLSLALHAILFGAVGTTGQRCTTLRRLIVHRSIYTPLLAKLQATYATLRIGNPIEPNHLVGPLIDKQAFEAMAQALTEAVAQGGNILTGGERVLAERYPAAYYVKPALVEMPGQTEVVRRETFAPILYVLSYDTLEESIQLNNAVPQGLSSSIFSTDMREVEQFLSAAGSDCGIANVNMGPAALKSAGPSVARKKPAETARADQMPGSNTCAAPPTPSTTHRHCPWRRGSSFWTAMTPKSHRTRGAEANMRGPKSDGPSCLGAPRPAHPTNNLFSAADSCPNRSRKLCSCLT
jgi:aldehyde dehydrogenase (NAD+)